ncbi:hypothetical protein BgiBS90_001760 [Biomphalaria glabrata]|nr:hypothetical protein BgiBS90_001760 [Biomphalaria glabrata]
MPSDFSQCPFTPPLQHTSFVVYSLKIRHWLTAIFVYVNISGEMTECGLIFKSTPFRLYEIKRRGKKISSAIKGTDNSRIKFWSARREVKFGNTFFFCRRRDPLVPSSYTVHGRMKRSLDAQRAVATEPRRVRSSKVQPSGRLKDRRSFNV